jgi:hypothetical protein
MNSRHHRLIGILILLLGLAASHTALAEDIVITSVLPDEAAQGTLDTIKIHGSGFDKRIKAVKFLLPCTPDPEPCTGTDGGITVTEFKVDDRLNITATIDISETAELGKFYIAMTRGRGGKGTTFKSGNLFEVKLRPKSGFSLHDITAEYTGLVSEEAFQPGDDGFPAGWVNWTTNTLLETPRYCLINVHLVDPPTAGRYDCDYEGADGGRISIDLAGIEEAIGEMPWVAVKSGKKTPPNPEFCELLNRWDEFPDDVLSENRLPLEFGAYRYTINFMEGCTVSDCHIGISHQSYNGNASGQGAIELHPFHDLTQSRLPVDMEALPDVGRLIVKTWATGVPASDDYNAFIQPQTLAIEGFEIRFGSTKNGAVLAACRTLVDTVNDVVLQTCPDPPGCVD